MIRSIIYLTLAGLCLSACGSTTQDRAISGAGIGAGAGAIGGALTGGNVGTGAVLGGLGGALVGGATKQNQLDLGKPVWKR